MRKSVSLTVFVLLLFCAAFPAAAHSIDYLATNISPASTFNGQSGNITVTNPVPGGAAISFTITFQVVSQGNTTTFPKTIAFGSSTLAPAGTAIDVSTIPSCTFSEDAITKAINTCTTPVTITAPTAPGTYTVQIAPTAGTGGKDGLSGGGGITIGFTVETPPTPEIEKVPTDLTLSVARCSLLGTPTVTLSATLTAKGAPLANQEITFSVDGTSTGPAVLTNEVGVASVTYNSGLLSVGDHTVIATFAGKKVGSTEYGADTDNASLGVEYNFLGFQQPINANGSSIFNGKVIPVKIKITDYFGHPVTNAVANVFFALASSVVTGSEVEAAVSIANTADGGNIMRYDVLADQYVFNWDNSAQPNGTYRVRVGLGEGYCGDPHVVTLSLGKKK